MALANVAWLLATAGKQVLVVDWDLEAPGLHRYFHPFLKDKELHASDGVIDFVIEFEDQATARTGRQDDEDWYLPYANILRQARSVDYDFPAGGTLDFIPAGRQTNSYASRVNSFDWGNFYERLGGWALIEEAKRLMREEYEFVLVDSRTGVSDSAGICTVQLPDDLVVCYTLNTQSIEGASAVAANVFEKRRRRPDLPLRIFPVAMRVEKAESNKRELRRDYARAGFDRRLIPGEDPKATPGQLFAFLKDKGFDLPLEGAALKSRQDIPGKRRRCDEGACHA
jgi:MinD-like ATPase involved in chromosome partitioning or flagellar assembly